MTNYQNNKHMQKTNKAIIQSAYDKKKIYDLLAKDNKYEFNHKQFFTDVINYPLDYYCHVSKKKSSQSGMYCQHFFVFKSNACYYFFHSEEYEKNNMKATPDKVIKMLSNLVPVPMHAKELLTRLFEYIGTFIKCAMEEKLGGDAIEYQEGKQKYVSLANISGDEVSYHDAIKKSISAKMILFQWMKHPSGDNVSEVYVFQASGGNVLLLEMTYSEDTNKSNRLYNCRNKDSLKEKLGSLQYIEKFSQVKRALDAQWMDYLLNVHKTRMSTNMQNDICSKEDLDMRIMFFMESTKGKKKKMYASHSYYDDMAKLHGWDEDDIEVEDLFTKKPEIENNTVVDIDTRERTQKREVRDGDQDGYTSLDDVLKNQFDIQKRDLIYLTEDEIQEICNAIPYKWRVEIRKSHRK